MSTEVVKFGAMYGWPFTKKAFEYYFPYYFDGINYQEEEIVC